jgi:hypothetical protein
MYTDIEEYIESNNLSFTEWLQDKSIDMGYVFKWFDKWDKIPSIAYTTISSRRDSLLFYKYPRIYENPKEFFRFIKYQMTSNYISSHFSIIKNRIEDQQFHDAFNNFIQNTKNKQNITIEFYDNLLALLAYLDKQDEFFYFYNSVIFKGIENVNSHGKLAILIKKTYNYVANLLNNGVLTVGGINILEGILDVFMNIELGMYDTQLFIYILNNYNKSINIYNKEQILSYLFMCFMENEGISQDLLEFDRDVLYEMYEKTVQIDTKLIILQFFVFMDKAAPEMGPFYKPRFIYKFLKEFNMLLDDFYRNVKIIEYFLNREELEDDLHILLSAKQHILYTNGYLEVLEKIIELENMFYRKVLLRSDIRKYLCNLLIVHLEVFVKSGDRYKSVGEYMEEYNVLKFLCIFEQVYKYYSGDQDMVEEIIDDMNKEQYDLFIDWVGHNPELKIYTKMKKTYIDYPLDCLDAISMEPLKNFIEMPDSKLFLNRETIMVYLYDSKIDPFTRKEITMEKIEEYNKQAEVRERVLIMKRKIDEFVKRHDR